MRLFRSSLLGLSLLTSTSLVSCALSDDDTTEEDLGDIGDGKSDSFGVVDREFTIDAGKTRRFTFTANAAFRVAVTQPTMAVAKRTDMTLSLKKPDGDKESADAATEPTLVLPEGGGTKKFTLTVKNVGTKDTTALLNVRPMGGFGELPNPNAPTAPEVSWMPPGVATWPPAYVIFNNTGCSHDCTQADSTALAPRSVMIKMLVAAIDNAKQDGIIRVSNFNISGSASVKPVVDALLRAIQTKHATVKIVMDEAQNNATSRTTLLSQQGAQVRFLDGIHSTSGTGAASVGIMHSKIVVVDDEVVFTGSNNFSSTGFVTNEENSVVLRGAENASRITSFQCDVDKMFAIGVEAGKPQRSDAAREADILALDACNGTDVWFPPTGVVATGTSITLTKVLGAIGGATASIDLAPDMLAHPGIVSAIIARGKKAKAAGTPFAVRLVLDASEEALGNPAFGECLSAAATKFDLDIAVRYWPGTAEIFQLMHHKFMIVDAGVPAKAALFNGSANYSAKALKLSFENVTRYTTGSHREIVDAFTARFAQLFTQAKTKAKLASDDGLTVPTCPLNIDTL
jgi:phosphatidylserine/phosphatidylglycerophosphate/cardiolipin synthase-like enzyme